MELSNDSQYNTVAEHLIEFATDFFSLEKNHSLESLFLPVLLAYSQKMDGGKKFDLSIFKSTPTPEQLEFCKRVFSRATRLTLGTNQIPPQFIFNYILKAQKNSSFRYSTMMNSSSPKECSIFLN